VGMRKRGRKPQLLPVRKIRLVLRGKNRSREKYRGYYAKDSPIVLGRVPKKEVGTGADLSQQVGVGKGIIIPLVQT